MIQSTITRTSISVFAAVRLVAKPRAHVVFLGSARCRLCQFFYVTVLHFSASYADAGTIHVPAELPSIQLCIDVAVSGQDECLVAPGVYSEAIDFLGKEVVVRSTHGPTVTTIAPNTVAPVGTFASGEGPGAVLQGFTLTGGIAAAINAYGDRAGGGLFIDGSSPSVIDCTVSANLAGAGIFARDSEAVLVGCQVTEHQEGGLRARDSQLIVAKTSFLSNQAFVGAGLASSGAGSLLLTNCLFRNNRSDVWGGALWCAGSVALTVVKTRFEENLAEGGGAVYTYGIDASFVDCAFLRNRVIGAGGGLFVEGGTTVIRTSNFAENGVDGPLFPRGGAIESTGALFIANSTFRANRANGVLIPGGTGGALSAQGPITLVNTLFNRNSADFASEMSIAVDACTIASSTIFGDRASGANTLIRIASCHISNTIVWGSDSDVLQIENAGVLTLGWSNIEHGPPAGDVVDLGGNMDLEPAFVDPCGPDGVPGSDDDNLRLTRESPCVEAGNSSVLLMDLTDIDGNDDSLEQIPIDLDGHARVLCAQLDIGAFESGVGDGNCDGLISLDDLALMHICLSGPGGGINGPVCSAFDFAYDADVDLRDFYRWLEAWNVQLP